MPPRASTAAMPRETGDEAVDRQPVLERAQGPAPDLEVDAPGDHRLRPARARGEEAGRVCARAVQVDDQGADPARVLGEAHGGDQVQVSGGSEATRRHAERRDLRRERPVGRGEPLLVSPRGEPFDEPEHLRLPAPPRGRGVDVEDRQGIGRHLRSGRGDRHGRRQRRRRAGPERARGGLRLRDLARAERDQQLARHRLGRERAARERPARAGDARAQGGVGGERAQGVGERVGIARGHEHRVAVVRQELADRLGVPGDDAAARRRGLARPCSESRARPPRLAEDAEHDVRVEHARRQLVDRTRSP
jgi:hypothetical protein